MYACSRLVGGKTQNIIAREIRKIEAVRYEIRSERAVAVLCFMVISITCFAFLSGSELLSARYNFSAFLTFNVFIDMEDFSYWNK